MERQRFAGICERLGFCRRTYYFYEYWIDPNANRRVLVYREGKLLQKDEHGKLPLDEREQRCLDNAIDWFEEGEIDKVTIGADYINEFSVNEVGGLKIAISRTTKLPYGKFAELYNEKRD